MNSSFISSLVFCRVYGFGNATTAVMAATKITSSTGYLPEEGGDCYIDNRSGPENALRFWIKLLAKACRLASPAPCDVRSDEEGAPETSEDTQEDERDEFEKVPRRVVFDVEQHQSAVAEWVYGAQDERCNQGGEEGTPQRLEREVVAHLEEGESGWLKSFMGVLRQI